MINVIRKRRSTFMVIIVLGMFLIFLNNFNIGINLNRTLLDVNISRQTDASMKCFKNLNETLPDISTVRPDWKKAIYFIEVSCRSSTLGRITILPRQACAIESAAFTNPDSEVYVLYASRGAIENQGSLSDYLLEVLASYKNIKFLHIDIDRFVNGSIVESLYKEKIVYKAAFPMIVSSDVVRLLILQKYGGLYLDLDVMVLKNLDDLPLNSIGLETDISVNNAVIRADNSDVGQRFTKLCLEELKNHFDGSKWDTTGPYVVTKIMKKMCGVKKPSLMPKSNCSGFTVFPEDAFYPISWKDKTKYFENQTSPDLYNRIVNNSYVVHVWNKFSNQITASETPNSIFNNLAKEFCPRVFNDASKYF